MLCAVQHARQAEQAALKEAADAQAVVAQSTQRMAELEQTALAAVQRMEQLQAHADAQTTRAVAAESAQAAVLADAAEQNASSERATEAAVMRVVELTAKVLPASVMKALLVSLVWHSWCRCSYGRCLLLSGVPAASMPQRHRVVKASVKVLMKLV